MRRAERGVRHGRGAGGLSVWKLRFDLSLLLLSVLTL